MTNNLYQRYLLNLQNFLARRAGPASPSGKRAPASR